MRTHLACRPIIGLFMLPRYIDISKLYRPVWVVKHDRIDIYLRDPYRMRAGTGDPRLDWGRLEQAFPFRTADQAEYLCESADWQGTIVEVDRNLVRRAKDPRLRSRG
jgi:hypothetical protein